MEKGIDDDDDEDRNCDVTGSSDGNIHWSTYD